MQLLFVGKNEKVDSETKTLYQAKTGEIITHVPNKDAELFEHLNYWLSDLHYANFGGVFIKLIFFILAIISCIVFYSGGLLWIETRKNKLKGVTFYFEGIIWGLVISIALTFSARLLTGTDSPYPIGTGPVSVLGARNLMAVHTS